LPGSGPICQDRRARRECPGPFYRSGRRPKSGGEEIAAHVGPDRIRACGRRSSTVAACLLWPPAWKVESSRPLSRPWRWRQPAFSTPDGKSSPIPPAGTHSRPDLCSQPAGGRCNQNHTKTAMMMSRPAGRRSGSRIAWSRTKASPAAHRWQRFLRARCATGRCAAGGLQPAVSWQAGRPFSIMSNLSATRQDQSSTAVFRLDLEPVGAACQVTGKTVSHRPWEGMSRRTAKWLLFLRTRISRARPS